MQLSPECGQHGLESTRLRRARLSPQLSQLVAQQWPIYGCQVKAGLFDAAQQFKTPQPLILDIGFGTGTALHACARQHPEFNFLGVEVYPPGVAAVLKMLEAEPVDNLRLYCADVKLVLEQCLATQALFGVHIFFPDPWPKRRHNKRRLVQPDFLTLLASKMQVGGFLHIATDWQAYQQHCMTVISQHPNFIFSEKPRLGARVETKFESRGKQLLHEIYDIHASYLNASE